MRKILFAFLFLNVSYAVSLKAQDTVRIEVKGRNVVTVVDEGGDHTDVKIGKSRIPMKERSDDTLKFRIGRRAMIISDGRHGSTIRFERLGDREYEKWTGHPSRFKGHWAGFALGVNSFANVRYQGFTPNFMDLNHNKSFEVGINFLQYNFGLQKARKNIGLVTGLGFTFNDYRFTNGYTIENNGGLVEPVALDPHGLLKSKLSTSFLNAPLMIEFQVPLKGHDRRVYFSGGMIGGLKLGSHTKVKYEGDKNKNHDDFQINPFRYGTTARIGYRGINLFSTYYFTTFFRSGRGPELNPFTIGIVLMNW